jgi:uncharacterized OB-fold protein
MKRHEIRVRMDDQFRSWCATCGLPVNWTAFTAAGEVKSFLRHFPAQRTGKP